MGRHAITRPMPNDRAAYRRSFVLDTREHAAVVGVHG
jgi:hypothetical protein